MILFDREITLVQQTEKTCVLACIAMISGHSLQELFLKFPQFAEKPLTGRETKGILDALNIDYIQYIDDAMYWGRVYMLSVPSLNFELSAHCILADYRDVNNPKIFDPNENYPGRKWYTIDTLNKYANYSGVLEIVGEAK